MTEKLKVAAQQALKALDIACHKYGDVGSADTDWGRWNAASAALRAALAEPTGKQPLQVEPVAWRYKGDPWFDGDRWHDKFEVATDRRVAKFRDKDATPLYAAPPKNLAEPEAAQEPVAWMWEETASRTSTGIGGVDRKLLFCRPVDEPWKRNITPLYTHPPQRPSLTDEEIEHLSRTMVGGNKSVQWLARIIERKVRGEKE